MAEVLHLFICLRHRLLMKALEEVRAVADKGFEHCAHGRPGSTRQVLLIDAETLHEFGLNPGDVKENITTRGLAVRELKRGQRVRIGEAVLEVTIRCESCGRMDDLRPGLQAALRGKRGMLCRVIQEGTIRRGDAIHVLELAKVGD